MNFLKYVEHSAENLQFYLWFKDYIKRFEELPEGERDLSPEWTQAQEEAEVTAYRAQLKQKSLTVEAHEILKSKNLIVETEASTSEKQDSLAESRDGSSDAKRESETAGSGDRPKSGFRSTKTGLSHSTEAAFEDAGCKFQPCEFIQVMIISCKY
jgi:hypothetical protein